jgi:hypothetical protein
MYKKTIILLSLATLLFLTLSGCNPTPQKKIGILFGNVGTPDNYSPDWVVQFFEIMFDIFPPGFLAGGSLEGGTCYTYIHYANEAESLICDVPEGTLIDVFCNEYTGEYPVHSLMDHWPLPGGDGGFETDCFTPFEPAMYVLTFGDSTIDPATGKTIYGPHIDDPDGSGIGIADFLETVAFSNMDLYSRIPNQTLPFRQQLLKWWYGNDAPGYTSDSIELINIKDKLEELMPEYAFVFRHGWDAYGENIDTYGNPHQWADSHETVITELIEKEKVDMLVVAFPNPFHNNLKQYGDEWYDSNGQGVSAIADTTYKECVEDTSDGVGPATQEEVDTFRASKAWEKHWKHPFPLIKHIAETLQPTIDIRFASGYGEFEEYDLALLDMLDYTIEKYSIPEDSALKVILLEHGYDEMYLGAAACDSYHRMNKGLADRLIKSISDNISWSGRFEVVSAPYGYAEAADDALVSQDEPFGETMSVGEYIEDSINGTYVNALGKVTDNGIDNFDTVIVLNSYFHSDDTDVLYETREVMGNNNYFQGIYERDTTDADGTDYDANDIDEDYYTVSIMDGTGWPGIHGCIEDPDNCASNTPVYKGSPQKPTKVIICGTFLGNSQGAGRDNFTEAEVKAIMEAIGTSDEN